MYIVRACDLYKNVVFKTLRNVLKSLWGDQNRKFITVFTATVIQPQNNVSAI